jgi:hypothetical protein
MTPKQEKALLEAVAILLEELDFTLEGDEDTAKEENADGDVIADIKGKREHIKRLYPVLTGGRELD